MTMPDERSRAIRWGQELLGQISEDATLPESLTKAARRIASTYPSSQDLEVRLRIGAEGLPPGWAATLLDAVELFEKLQVEGLGSNQTRRGLMYTLRHFPDGRTIHVMSRSASLRDWLQPTDV